MRIWQMRHKLIIKTKFIHRHALILSVVKDICSSIVYFLTLVRELCVHHRSKKVSNRIPAPPLKVLRKLCYSTSSSIISTFLRWTIPCDFWYQYIPVISWPVGLYSPLRLVPVHDLYHQAPWWSTAQFEPGEESESLSLVEKVAPRL